MCLCCLTLGSALFVLKYSVRVPGVTESSAIAAAIAFAAAYAGALVLLVARRKRRHAASWRGAGPPRFLTDELVGLFVVALVVLALVTPNVTRVSRLPAIENWLGALMSGQFPYCTSVDPSGLPGLFFIALPLWALDLTWLLAPIGLGLTWWLARKALGLELGWLGLVALAGLPAVYYEVIVKSELVFNGALSIGAVALAWWAWKRGTVPALVLAAMLGGAVASTRLSAALVLFVCGITLLRRSPGFAVRYGILSVAVFMATVIPFYVWSPTLFVDCGPFAVQGGYLTGPWTIAVAVAALGIGWNSDNAQTSLAASGILIWMATGVAFVSQVLDVGFEATVWGDKFDLAYFVLAVPLLLIGLVGAPCRVENERAAVPYRTKDLNSTPGQDSKGSPIRPDHS